ncbi:hypothetical protein [Nonomuraea cavernae]|uniref:hypothetical protein n=1 Tax=Nonomuraea cavernae TaxID=2045107 RepID=UPI0034114B33
MDALWLGIAADQLVDGYEAPFYKADREAEYRQAHAVFAERLQQAQAVQQKDGDV